MPSKDFLALNPGFNAVDMPGANRASKYGNRKVQADGYVFDSHAESARYGQLQLMVSAGAISDLRVHPIYELQRAFVDRVGVRQRAIYYEGDFEYWEKGKKICEDVKGTEVAVFRIKRKLFLYNYPHIELRIIKV